MFPRCTLSDSLRHQSSTLKWKWISARAAIWPWVRPELMHQSQGTQCVLNWINPVRVRLLFALCGSAATELAHWGSGTGWEDKELRADTQSKTSVLCSLSTQRNVTHLQPLPPSHTLSLQDMGPHTGVAITFPQTWMTLVLTQLPPCFVPFSPFPFRERWVGWGVGGSNERQPLCQKWQHLFKVTSYWHAAERGACQSCVITQRLAAPGSRKSRRLHMPFFSSHTHSAFGPDPHKHWHTHLLLVYTVFELGTQNSRGQPGHLGVGAL